MALLGENNSLFHIIAHFRDKRVISTVNNVTDSDIIPYITQIRP